MSIFEVTGALLPIFGLVLLGVGLRRFGFPEDSFWPQADRLTYYVLFPALIIDNLANTRLNQPELLPLTLILVISILCISTLTFIFSILFKTPATVFTSVLQGSIRPNTYVGLAGAASLYGTEGVALTTVAIASVVPLVNVISVTAFVQMIPQGRSGIKAVLMGILKNPLIVGCLLGLFLSVSQWGLSGPPKEMMAMLGKASLPLGLISVGAALRIQTLGNWFALSKSSIFKLILSPVLVWGLCMYFGVEGMPRGVAVLYAALPCSVSSYTLSAQMGGDKNLVAGIITVQTLLAMLSIPWILGSFA